ncbi:hypothetical protein Tco_1223929 [Tanacetum coccineum]
MSACRLRWEGTVTSKGGAIPPAETMAPNNILRLALLSLASSRIALSRNGVLYGVIDSGVIKKVMSVAFGLTFDDDLREFNTTMKAGVLSNPSEITTQTHEETHTYIFTGVTKTAKSAFFFSRGRMALRKSQLEDHTSNMLRALPILSLEHIMNGKEVDIRLGGGQDKPSRVADMLLYSLIEDEVTLVKRIQKFSVTQDIQAHIAIQISSSIRFAIVRVVRVQIVSGFLLISSK